MASRGSRNKSSILNMKQKNEYGVIYLITNLVNGKCYVGQTVQLYPLQRWAKHRDLSRKGDKRPLYHSIRKYGFENFKFEVLWHSFDKESLDLAENIFIQDKNAMTPNGYNLHEGGAWGRHLPETKVKISEASKRHMQNPETKRRALLVLEMCRKSPEIQTKRISACRKIKGHNTSGYLGVSKHGNKWIAQIAVNKKYFYLGRFSRKEDAALAYNFAAQEHLGESARMNIA